MDYTWLCTMKSARPFSTVYRGLSYHQALAVVILTIATFEVCLLTGGPIHPIGLSNLVGHLRDSVLFEAVAAKVQNGDNYYDATAYELSSQGYPTKSVFNWRMPSYVILFRVLPTLFWRRALLLVCTLIALRLACSLASSENGRFAGLAVGLVLTGDCAWQAYPQPVYFMETWSGILILISVCSIAMRRWRMGVAAGTLALLLRELALPYCGIALLLAWKRREKQEFISWCVVICVYLVLFSIHYHNVQVRLPGGETTGNLGWLVFGGMRFVLETCSMAYFLMVLPHWCVALYLPLSLLGLFGWRSRDFALIKLTATAYILLFLCIGIPVNYYWGWMYTPTLAFGTALSPFAVRDLIHVLILQPKKQVDDDSSRARDRELSVSDRPVRDEAVADASE